MDNNSPKLTRRQKARLRKQESNQQQVPFYIKSLPLGGSDTFQALLTGMLDSNFIYEVAEKNSLISYCIELIADEFASNDLFLTRRVSDKNYVPFKTRKRYDHALAKPNVEDTQVMFLKKFALAYLTASQVAIIRLQPKKGQTIYEVWQHRYISISTDLTGKPTYKLNAGGKLITIPPEDIIFIKKPGFRNNGKTPHSPVQAVIQETVMYNRIIQHENNQLQNGMMAKGVLAQKADSPVKYNSDQLAELARQFTDATSGSRSSDTLGLPPGLEFVPVQVKAIEEGIFDILKSAQDAILRAFRVPRSFFDNNSDSYSTSEIQRKQFYQNVILPMMKTLEDALNNWEGITSETEWFQFDKSKVTTSEEKKAEGEANQARSADVNNLSSSGIASLNEMRIRAGLEPLLNPDGTPIPEAELIPLLVSPTKDTSNPNPDQQNQAKGFYNDYLLKQIHSEINGETKED